MAGTIHFASMYLADELENVRFMDCNFNDEEPFDSVANQFHERTLDDEFLDDETNQVHELILDDKSCCKSSEILFNHLKSPKSKSNNACLFLELNFFESLNQRFSNNLKYFLSGESSATNPT